MHHELGLANRAHRFGPVVTVTGTALDEDGGNDVVSALQIRGEVLREVLTARSVPVV